MLFNTLQFALFLACVLMLHRVLPARHRVAALLAASLLFYSLWLPAYLLLLVSDIGVNYLLLRGIARRKRPRLFLTLSIVFTLSLLGYFKYAALAVETALPALRALFELHPAIPDVFLPLGISFYSFQIIALAIDVHRGREAAAPSLQRYALFISFFPQLIAGPILRGRELLPQLVLSRRATPEQTRRGLWLLASGIGKKVVLADFLLAGFVDDVFDTPGVGGGAYHWVALYSFTFQIYFDFSGYTDMARGIACLLGFELPLNFAEPYLSRNPAEFWRRWHMTLSRWLRDYLYIPLGGNRRGSANTYLNLVITMLLGGLWHGAAWNFVVWGGLHGLLLVLHRRFGGRRSGDDPALSLRDTPRIFLQFHAVALLWVFFRAPSFDEAMSFLGGLVSTSEPVGWPVGQSLVVVLCFALHALERALLLRLPRIQAAVASSPLVSALSGVALGALIGLALAVSGAGGEFIYFQF